MNWTNLLTAVDGNVWAIIGIITTVMIINQVLALVKEYGKEMFDKKIGNGTPGAIKKVELAIKDMHEDLKQGFADRPPYPQCYYDKKHFDRVIDIQEKVEFIKETQEEQRRMIDKGNFSCCVKEEHLRKIEKLP